ncbi:MAG: hypothetical protein ACK4M4_00915 [Flavobacterium sp.]
MEVKLQSKAFTEVKNESTETTGYYLISARWTVINDSYITFVRKKGPGYCYNMDWAGPLSKFDVQKLNSYSSSTIIVSHQLLKEFLLVEGNQIFLPNSPEVRRVIGLNSGELQVAN